MTKSIKRERLEEDIAAFDTVLEYTIRTWVGVTYKEDDRNTRISAQEMALA